MSIPCKYCDDTGEIGVGIEMRFCPNCSKGRAAKSASVARTSEDIDNRIELIGEPQSAFEEYQFLKPPEYDPDWKLYIYGSRPNTSGATYYRPLKGHIPNRFVRYMMKVVLGCTWVKTN